MNAGGKQYAVQNERDDTHLSEEDATCVVCRPFYGWVNAFLARGWRRHRRKELIEVEDLLRLPHSEEAERCYNVFQPMWLLELERYQNLIDLSTRNDSSKEHRGTKTPLPRLFRVLLYVYKWEVLFGGLCRLLGDGCMLATPFIFRELVGWLQRYAAFDETSTTSPSEPPKWEGFVYSIVLFISVFMLSFFHNASLYYTTSAFCKMRNSVALSVFEKSLRLHCDHGLTGVAIQLHTSDANKFVDSALFFHQMWSSPLFILAALIALYDFVGWSGVISIGIMLAFLPVQVISTSYMTKLRGVAARLADRRLASLNEMLLGIRIVKFMRWEKPLTERILRVRQIELKNLIWIQFFRSVMTTLTSIQPVIVFLCVFLIAWGLDEPITPVSVFPTFAMLNLLRLPLGQLPLSFARFVDLVIALRRLTAFLIAPEKVAYIQAIDRPNLAPSNEPFAASSTTTEYAIVVENLCVRYTDTQAEGKNKGRIKADPDQHTFIIQDINLRLPRGKLTMVIGPTGSGKSTLLTALMGEASVTPESRVVVDGAFAYVPQEAWIMNDTVRNNIIMNRPYDEAHYLHTVRSCQLIADLHQMQNSDQTEIGESGVNMSGGQKQRIAFARAVYSDRDVYIMDDPLSAVDSHVSLALLENCVCGALANKTRLLVTHQVQYLPRADYVVVMAGCRLRFQGTYEELLLSGLDIAAVVEGSPKETEEKEDKQKDETETKAEKEEAKEEHKEDYNNIPPPSEEKLKGMMTIEKQQQGSIRFSTFALYYHYQGILVVFFTVVTFLVWRAVLVFSDLLFSWWSVRQPVLNYTLDDRGYAIWLSITIAVGFVLQGIRQIPFIVGTVFCARYNFEHMLLRLVKAPTSFFDTTPLGRIVARFSKDVEVVDLIIPDTLNLLYHMILIILGSFALMVYAGPYNIILVIIMCGGFAPAFVYFSPSNRSLKRLEAVTRSPMASIIAQTLGGLATIRAYDCSSLFKAPHTAAVNVAARTTYTWRSTLRWMSLRIDTLSAFITLGTSLVSCGLMISADSSSSRTELLPVMALAISHSLNFVTAMNLTANILAEFESSFSSIERCKEYADEVPQENDIAAYSEEHPPPPPRWPEHGAVEFSNVCMRYAPDKPLVLKNISVRIEAGHKVGIVGRTGSGKSTIMLALFRMVEIESGAISIDGVNINAVTIDDLRNSLTIIPQDPMLFAGTIRSNLDPFSRFTDEQVWNCIRTVGLEERVRGKPFSLTEEADKKQRAGTGLDTPVAERGSNFSVGQRQLLCLARALLKECKVLLLDEATASVDYESDALIQRTIQHAFAHCTVLTIAHRLATIIHSDRVLVLNQGVVAEYDRPAALLERKEGQLYNMVAALGPEQFKQLQRAANSEPTSAT